MNGPLRIYPHPLPSDVQWRAENLVALWNARCAIGTRVCYRTSPRDHQGFVTRTRSAARLHTAAQPIVVVELEGLMSPVPIDHLVLER